jgi:hypothetical protein
MENTTNQDNTQTDSKELLRPVVAGALCVLSFEEEPF